VWGGGGQGSRGCSQQPGGICLEAAELMRQSGLLPEQGCNVCVAASWALAEAQQVVAELAPVVMRLPV
jgi:hypothetical protein